MKNLNLQTWTTAARTQTQNNKSFKMMSLRFWEIGRKIRIGLRILSGKVFKIGE